jgi:hypothetical protein
MDYCVRASTRDSPLQRPVTWMLGNRRACEERRGESPQQAAFGPDARAWSTSLGRDETLASEGDREPDSEGVIAAGVAIVHPRPGSCGRVGRVGSSIVRCVTCVRKRFRCQAWEAGGVSGTNGDTVKSCVSPPTAATPVCAGRPRRSSACAARGRRRGCRPAAKRPRARLPLSPHPGARARRRLCARTPTQTDRSIGKGGEAGGHRQGTLTSSQQAGLSLSPTLTLPLNRRGRP